jgi:hypothetical protein
MFRRNIIYLCIENKGYRTQAEITAVYLRVHLSDGMSAKEMRCHDFQDSSLSLL